MKKFVHSMCLISPIIVMVAPLLAVAAFAVAVATANPEIAAVALGCCGVGLVAYGVTIDPEIVGVSPAALSRARGRGFDPAEAAPGDSVAHNRFPGTDTESMEPMNEGEADGRAALWRASSDREEVSLAIVRCGRLPQSTVRTR